MFENDRRPLEGSDADAPTPASGFDADAPTPASGFDARRRLNGEYDDLQFHRAGVAQDFSGGAGGESR